MQGVAYHRSSPRTSISPAVRGPARNFLLPAGFFFEIMPRRFVPSITPSVALDLNLFPTATMMSKRFHVPNCIPMTSDSHLKRQQP